MMATVQTRTGEKRRMPRYGLQEPVDVTVLRSGVPDTIPGRALNVCEAGAAVVLAGEVSPGEAVGFELRLPETGDSLRMRALIKHQDKLRCGMEFVGLSAEQEVAIRRWTSQGQPINFKVAEEKLRQSEGGAAAAKVPESRMGRERKRISIFLALILLTSALVGAGWWKWNRAWVAIEAASSSRPASTEQQPVEVAADLMEKLVVQRVEPEYPAAARKNNLHGLIVLDVVVGSDGSVLELRPKNGPEVLAQAAVNALRWWKFEPYRLNGEPIRVQTTLAIEFRP